MNVFKVLSLDRFFSSFLVGVSVPLWLIIFASGVRAQTKTAELKAPEPGYITPAGGKAGTTIDVLLGGYDWTPDVQLFVLDQRVKLQLIGEQGQVLVPPPPYWFGPKAYIAPAPLPRERPAKLTLPADLPAGPIRWAVASASGAGTKTGIFWIGTESEVNEEKAVKLPQKLPALPVTVNGRLSKVEEVDRYRFLVAKDGPVTCEVFARRLGVNINVSVSIRDPRGYLVADAVDTDGNDLALTFWAKANTEYTLNVYDFDFRGDASFVYRLALSHGPRVCGVVPAMGKRGETRDMEFVGYGLATGKQKLESVTRKLTFPADSKKNTFKYRLETTFGNAPLIEIPLSDNAESLAAKDQTLSIPAAVTGVFDGTVTEARFKLTGKKGDVWNLTAEARRFGSPLDISLAIFATDGKELAHNDDLPGTTDAGLAFTLPTDGLFTVAVSDLSGKSVNRAAIYRLSIAKPTPDFALTTFARLNVPLGGTADLVVKAERKGGFKEPIVIKLIGLPEGVTVPPNLVIPADKSELTIKFAGAATAPAVATLVTISGTAGNLTHLASAPIPGSFAALSPDEERTTSILLATTLAPRLKLVAVEADGGRKVHRGSTHPAEVTLERINGFTGEVSLQMSSAQSYQRQGITGPELTVPAKDDRAFYPCFMPEWLETTRTSRMELIGVVKVSDAKGTIRYLATPMNGRITMSIEGAILKVAAQTMDVKIKPGETIAIPVSALCSAKLNSPVHLEMKLPKELTGVLTAEPITIAPGVSTAQFKITCAKDSKLDGEFTVTIRGTAMQDGKYAVVSEVTVKLELPAK
jgi:hypothetical protein